MADSLPMKGQPLWDRVMTKIRFPADPTCKETCWEWKGALSKKRGGPRPVVQLGKRKSPIVLVARLICEWYHGEPEAGMEAGHTCPAGENSRCVSPYHLKWMTRVENERYKRKREEEVLSAAGVFG